MPPQAADRGATPPSSLSPAAENPWYVLATIYGEQTVSGPLQDISRASNRRIWNGWFCGCLPAARRSELAEIARLPIHDLSAWTEQEEAEVKQKFAAKNIFLPDPEAPVDFSNTNFEDHLYMSRFIFTRYARFDNLVFKGDARFDHAIFSGPSEFSCASFESDAGFNSATFGGDSAFESADFSGTLDLNYAKFKEEVTFYSTIFRKFAEFDFVNFQGKAIFNYTTFIGDAGFSSTSFENNAQFYSATFSRFAHFSEAKFAKEADFSDCHFERPTNFRRARFLTRFPILSGAILHPNTTFTAEKMSWPTIVEAPLEESRESLAIIRHAVGKQGLPEEEHYFYRREMACAARIGTRLQRLPYQAFGALSNFGYSLAKPALWLASVWFIGFLAYSYWLTWLAPTLAAAHPIFTAAGFSVAQLFGFLGFTGSYFGTDFLDALPTALKVLAGFQTVAGVVLLFFLGLGLRNRFRLK